MLERFHLTPDQVDELDEEFIWELDAKVWAGNQHQTVKQKREEMRSRMAGRGGRGSKRR